MSKQKHNICIILKNGTKINMRVNSAKVNKEKLTGDIVSFEFNGCDTAYPLYIDLKQVAAIVQRLPGPTPYSCAGCRWEDDPSCSCHGGQGFEPALDRITGDVPTQEHQAADPADPDSAEASGDEGQG